MRTRIAAALMIAVPISVSAEPNGTSPSWTSSGNGPDNTRASHTEHSIGPGSVSSLVPAWTLTTAGEVPDTPTVDAGSVYLSDAGGAIWRVAAASGAVTWSVKLPALSGNANSSSRNSPAIAPNAVIIGDQASASVYALSKTDGSLLWRTKLDGSRGAIITSSPVVVGNRVLVGVSSNQEELAATIKGFVPNFRGSVASLDLNTGAVRWQVYTVPAGFTGGAVWGSNLAADQKRGAVFIGTGDNYSVPAQVSACQAAAQNGKELDRCLPHDDHIDSIMSLDLATGAVKWSQRLTTLDTWTVSCLPSKHAPKTACPSPAGPDYDFGSAPNLFATNGSGPHEDLVGAGQKSGVYWAFDRDSGTEVWATQVAPGGTRGGIEWGSAVDGGRVYVAASNSNYVWTQLVGGGPLTDGGFWSALDVNTGKILWQTATDDVQKMPANKASRTIKPPRGALARAEGSVSVANGVMYAADASGEFVALDAATGTRLWKYSSNGAAVDGPAIAGGMVFWGDGYGDIGPEQTKIVAFGLPSH